MADVNVLVVFSSRYGRAEQIALAAGVGAIEAEGNIRLRRLPDEAAPAEIDADPAWRAALDRMNRDYVAPRPADPVWADVIIIATSPNRCTEAVAYLASLSSLGAMDGKVAAPLRTAVESASLAPLCEAIHRVGLVSVPAARAPEDLVERARLQGQRAVQVAHRLKAT